MNTYEGRIIKLPKNGIFVFGSNREGNHGKGAANTAYKRFGARWGQPKGLQGESYAIVTKDLEQPVHPSVGQGEIIEQIEILYEFARLRPHLEFYICYSGKGPNLNGYTPQQMADMFSAPPRPDNIIFEKEFSKLLTL